MYDIIKNVILAGNFELIDMLKKINTVWIENNITEEQKEELDNLARTNANAENSYAPLQEQIDKIYEKLDSIETRLNKLEGIEEPSEPTEEYPEFVQPQGSHDAYNIGDKVTYNGKKYICQMNGCVWTPDAYPTGWEEVN